MIGRKKSNLKNKKVSNGIKVRRALISVSDKTNLDKFVKGLDGLGVEIFSTGGTARFIRSLDIKVTEVSSYTGFPEIMDGRVKTLHPKIHGALLALRDKRGHIQQAKKHGIKLIDMVVVNLYPFSNVASKKGARFEEVIENIDIGGPAILRSAAKNFKNVAVVSDPDIYKEILDELQRNDCFLSVETLHRLAINIFKKTSEYDNAIFEYLKKDTEDTFFSSESIFPSYSNIAFSKVQDLRYGENPHQKAAFYKDVSNTFKDISVAPFSLACARQLHGKDLSFNNLVDLNAALEVGNEFKEPAACIIKHATPCGVAVARDVRTAFIDALNCDRLSAFGGIIGLNRKVDGSIAREIAKAGFIECIIAPSYEKEALEILTKKKNLRILELGDNKKEVFAKDLDMKKIIGGALFQERDRKDISRKDLRVVTKKSPKDNEIDSLYFAWKVAKHVKSNAIVLCQDKKTVGIGAGQMSRIDSVIIAIRKAGDKAKGSVLASDAFFPKSDSVEVASRAGISSIIQPGGSIADQEVIEAADKAGLSMVFTGIRHFKH
jgi:phosphoribosylaminoimidazolecarboxamide formyltransferase/IMP cyclohydrolase